MLGANCPADVALTSLVTVVVPTTSNLKLDDAPGASGNVVVSRVAVTTCPEGINDHPSPEPDTYAKLDGKVEE